MSKKDYINSIENAERRFHTNKLTVQKRMDADGEDHKPTIIEGYAAKFNQRTKIGNWFEEEILPGAFDDVLLDDVRCLKNHDASLLLARSNNGKGTLSLSIDATGLKYSFEIPKRTVGADLENEIDTGDITQSSFAFIPEEVVWIDREGELSVRQIKKVGKLFDVSPVTYPAYQDTTVGKRTLDNHIADIEVIDKKNISEQNSETKKRAFDVFDAQIQLNKYKNK